jgi:hypothetical protein
MPFKPVVLTHRLDSLFLFALRQIKVPSVDAA